MKDIKLGDTVDALTVLRPILSDASIFGVDLYEAGLAELVAQYFNELIAGPKAVEAVLKKYVK